MSGRVRVRRLAPALAVASLFAVPGGASAAVTIGSDLSGASGNAGCSEEPETECTIAQTALPGRTVAAPTDGVIVRWRVRDSVGRLALRVVRQPSPGSFTGAGTSAEVTLASPVPATFDTRLPVRAGDLIGADLRGGAELGFRRTNGAQDAGFFPPLADGAPPRPADVTGRVEVLINADIEPDADRDGFGDETQDLCAKDAATQGLCGGPCANDRAGGPAADNLQGTTAGDRLLGFEGDDVLTALAGDDCLEGGPGDDRMTADLGTDRIDGGDGDDSGDGGAGEDELLGGAGEDELSGGTEDDTVSGEADEDRLFGAAGDDSLDGGSGDDSLNGVSGADTLLGGTGGDSLTGGSNADLLRGASGNDRLNGGPGNDRLEGGPGNDRIDGGTGRSRISGGTGNDDIRAANRRRDRIACGLGRRDRVLADRVDRVARDCERVRRAR